MISIDDVDFSALIEFISSFELNDNSVSNNPGFSQLAAIIAYLGVEDYCPSLLREIIGILKELNAMTHDSLLA